MFFGFFVVQQNERSHAVDRDLLGRLGTELVVEYFQRQRSLVTRSIYCLHEIPNCEISLSGKAAEVPAPGKNVQVELRRIGKLNQEYAISWDRPDGRDGK